MNSPIATMNSTGWSNHLPNEVAEEFIAEATSAAGPVIDLGAAMGVATLPALATGAHVVAVDSDARHLVAIWKATPDRDRGRLRLVLGNFPEGVRLRASAFASVLASNLFHFLPGEKVESGLRRVADWLRPGGSLHVLVSSPHVAYLAPFIAGVKARQLSGAKWPGEIFGIRETIEPTMAAQLPNFLHVFPPEVLVRSVRSAGLEVISCRAFRRRDCPSFAHLDGRENVQILARKAVDEGVSCGTQVPRTLSPYLVSASPEVLRQIRSLRSLAWAADGVLVSPASRLYADDHDDHAFHFVVENHLGEIVAAARLCLHDRVGELPDAPDLAALPAIDGPLASINRLVVAPQWRSAGLAAELDAVRLSFARAADATAVVAVVGGNRIDALARQGFRAEAEILERSAVRLPGTLMLSRLG